MRGVGRATALLVLLVLACACGPGAELVDDEANGDPRVVPVVLDEAIAAVVDKGGEAS